MTEPILDSVKAKYGAVAMSSLSSDHDGVKAVAEAFGYSAEELISIPAEANMGLSCGNPTATAHLRPGEIVVDLGSGGGLDVFLAAKQVGAKGRAIGIDMTPAMIERARTSAAAAGYTNVDFYLAHIDKLPLPDASVDCVISNCVLNAPRRSEDACLNVTTTFSFYVWGTQRVRSWQKRSCEKRADSASLPTAPAVNLLALSVRRLWRRSSARACRQTGCAANPGTSSQDRRRHTSVSFSRFVTMRQKNLVPGPVSQ